MLLQPPVFCKHLSATSVSVSHTSSQSFFTTSSMLCMANDEFVSPLEKHL
ncbi:hypothetical protein L798_02286 [Zootermopsis nevadensis]|uniref:Uncharacterized protein n=1 Tax=Zootermopsis nevadensis TaxID=136037 RepID=A0A067RFE6_ZOONE|nr:hypothetical protein L798_02286 [Zootermopsis nevadensis]